MLYYYLFLPLIALLLEQSWVGDSQSVDCQKLCGDVIIEFPFGLIGTNCAANDYFTVTCYKGSSSGSNNETKAILSKFNLELVNIQVQSIWSRSTAEVGYLTVKSPIARACADHNRSSNGLNLTGSPFYIDTMKNVLASLGCHGQASLYINGTGHRIRRCRSRCNQTDQGVINGCNGYHCCQSDLRSASPFQRYRLQVTTRRSCRAGFLTSRTFLQTNSSLAAAMDGLVAVPIVLQWTYNGTEDRGKLLVLIFLFILLPISSIVTLVTSCCCFWYCWRCKTERIRTENRLREKYFKRKLKEEWSSNMEVVEKTKLFSLKELRKATNNFNEDRILGQGGQGTVYKGMLGNGLVIAIKKSAAFNERQWKQFINEVILLSKVNHRNVVKLLGCCLETKAPMLIYEFIPNGTLFDCMHNFKEGFTWEMRIRIASEAAGAISYLHSSLSTPIYHRDIKSTNILLDQRYRAKIADFGISKVVPMDKTHMTTDVQGTFGYLDPEYFRSSHFSEKSDVYSFGVILVELLTGQHPIRETTVEGEKSLVMYFISSMDAYAVNEILDPIVVQGGKIEEVMSVAKLATLCLKPRGIERPTMKDVAMELEGLRKGLSLIPNVAQKASMEIENVATRSPLEIGNAHTSPITYKDVNIMVGNCDDEQPLCRASW